MGLLTPSAEGDSGLLAQWDAWRRKMAANALGLLSSPTDTVNMRGWQLAEDIKKLAASGDKMLTGTPEEKWRAAGQGAEQMMPLVLTFAGPMAKTANKGLLAQAQDMTAKGADPVDVWKQTGWTDQFPDKMWRHEIPDTSLSVAPGALIDKGIYSSGNNWTHPVLREAYPDVKKINTVIQYGNRAGSGGEYNRALPSSGRLEEITVRGIDKNDATSVLIHELQHAVQHREGFARGGSPEDATLKRAYVDNLLNIASQKFAEAEAKWNDAIAKAGGDTLKAKKANPDVWKELLTWDQWAQAKALNDPSIIASKYLSKDFGYDAYKALAGEAEARLTQARMNLTPAERASRPPWLEFDVPREQQIVRMEGNGPSASKGLLDYRIQHKPMSVEGGAARLHDLAPGFGGSNDIYEKNALQYFGSGDPREKVVLQQLQRLRGKPDEMVTIYRGVPKNVDKINAGDWVSLSPTVAKDAGEKVISMKVPARDVTAWGDSLLEFGYYPERK